MSLKSNTNCLSYAIATVSEGGRVVGVVEICFVNKIIATNKQMNLPLVGRVVGGPAPGVGLIRPWIPVYAQV